MTSRFRLWWYLDARKRDRRAAFMERIAELTRWTDAHPDIPNLLTHGLVPSVLIHDIGIPKEVMDIIKRPNTYAELQNPAKWPEVHDNTSQVSPTHPIRNLLWAWATDMGDSG